MKEIYINFQSKICIFNHDVAYFNQRLLKSGIKIFVITVYVYLNIRDITVLGSYHHEPMAKLIFGEHQQSRLKLKIYNIIDV